ncbi:MAG TPA: isoprenylcysteine carboxylmethyltransferase family protein [Bdellovibrionota bacterium]|nr:isoprenylcysteine carboxylmethyltransferase family protein [Bdellovibrionota bacterium]
MRLPVTWLKGLGLAALFILLPASAVPTVYRDWRLWCLFGLTILFIGSQPNLRQSKLGSEQKTDEDRGTVTILHVVGYATVLIPYGHFLWRATNQVPCSVNGGYLSAIGAVCGAAGMILRAVAVRILGRWFTHTVQVQTNQNLVQSGPYRWIRHPSYTGALLFFGTIPFLLCVWPWILVFWPLWFLAYRRRITAEEGTMEKHFGQEYVAYKSRTWALFPYEY